MVQLQIQILIYLLIGWIFAKKNWLSKSTIKQLNFLVMNLILPCSIFNAFQSPQAQAITQQDLVFMMMLSIFLQVIMILVAHLIWRFIPDSHQRINLEYGTMFNNSGTLGMVIGQAAFGEIGVLYTSLFALPLRIGMWSYGLMVYSHQVETNLKAIFKKVVTNPCFLATTFGLISLLLEKQGFLIPDLLSSTIGSIGKCNTVLIMIVIGATLSAISFQEVKDSTSILYCIIRLLVIPFVLALVFWPFNLLGSIAGKVCILELAMPAPVTMAMLSQKYETNPLFASKIIFLSTLASMATLPLWDWILAFFH